MRFRLSAAVCLWIFFGISDSATSLAATPLNSSVLIFHEWDFIRCSERVDEVAKRGNTRVNFVPSLHYYTSHDFRLVEFCFRDVSGACVPFDQDRIHQLRQYFTACFQRAVDLNLEISVVPHLDWGGGTAIWRNFLVFDPVIRYNGFDYKQGFSYYDIMIHPIIESLRYVRRRNTTIELALQGEMGATIFSFPEKYRTILRAVKQALPGSQVKVGISLNYNKINGGVSPNAEQVRQIRRLIREADFLGISAYGSVSINPQPKDFINSIRILMNEFSQWKISVPKSKELHFSEIGLGGGTDNNDGLTPATTLEEAARCPWAGIRTAYRPTTDPWIQPHLRDLRFKYYRALTEFLKTQPAPWKVTSAFLWNANSWDFQALYNGVGFYEDRRIAEMVREYNESLRE